MGRPRLPVGAHGKITTLQLERGHWRARTLYRFADGRRRQVERFGSTRGKAENKLLEALTTIQVPDARTGKLRKSMTVAELAEVYIESKVAEGLSENTLTAYRQHVKQLIIPQLGAVVVAEMRPMRIQGFVDEVIKSSGGGTALGVRKVLRGMFSVALLNEVVPVNPVVGVRIIDKERGTRAAKALPVDQLEELLTKVRADTELTRLDIPDAFEFMAFTGARIGEVYAFRRSQILNDGKIKLGPVVVEVPGKAPFINEEGKTNSAPRIVIAAGRVLDLLEKRSVKAAEIDDELLFPSPLGGLRRPTRVMGIWADARAALGYPSLTSHTFRKTFATMLDDAGLSAREIADYLGHKRPSMTQDVYMGKNMQSPKVATAVNSKFGVSSGFKG